jgi:hypothetical protein
MRMSVVGVMFDSLGDTRGRASGTDAPQFVRLVDVSISPNADCEYVTRVVREVTLVTNADSLR